LIRVLGVDDLEALHALERRSQPAPWSDDQLLLELVNEDAVVLGMEGGSDSEGGAPTLHGYIALRRILEELWVLNLAVDPSARRHGHGRALLLRALAWGKAQELSSTWLEVREDNAAARALYESFGFEEVGRRPGYYPPAPPATERETALVMRRPL
jgi:[ribosomal protein S18]-alanine N-acetyltransferase